jgi:hypothetical protein
VEQLAAVQVQIAAGQEPHQLVVAAVRPELEPVLAAVVARSAPTLAQVLTGADLPAEEPRAVVLPALLAEVLVEILPVAPEVVRTEVGPAGSAVRPVAVRAEWGLSIVPGRMVSIAVATLLPVEQADSGYPIRERCCHHQFRLSLQFVVGD